MSSGGSRSQDKAEEIRFFAEFARTQEYEVFTPATNERLISVCLELAGVPQGATMLDLGCGSGVFTRILAGHGLKAAGLDLNTALLVHARRKSPEIPFVTGDIEHLPVRDASVDAVLLSGVVHHFPDPGPCAREVHRILRPGGCFVAFDPNRRNPIMWLYRDWDSPIRSRNGVTANERPILAEEVASVFTQVGFRTTSHFLSGLDYRHVASPLARLALPVYNAFDRVLQCLPWLARYRSFVLTAGVKDTA